MTTLQARRNDSLPRFRALNRRDVLRIESWGLKANGTSARAKSAPTIGKIHRTGSIR
jgi:hypothetical protein